MVPPSGCCFRSIPKRKRSSLPIIWTFTTTFRVPGYQYHHAFVNHRLNFYHYDRNWKSFLGMDYSLPSAARIAYNRLRWPVQLSERSQALYSQYLKAHASRCSTQILLEKDTAGLQFLLHEAASRTVRHHGSLRTGP